MALRRSIVFATSLFAPLPGLAREAEGAGFDRVWTTEFPDRDALVRATVIGMATERIGVATGIAYSFTRHPLALAAAALDVHEAIGGRFTLGLGTATAAMRSRWYGLDEGRAIGRLADAVSMIRGAWAADGRFRHEGEFFRGRVEGLDLAPRAAALPPLPIYGSGLNAAMLRGATRCCDGLGLHPLAAAPLYAERTVAPILAAARRRQNPGAPDATGGAPRTENGVDQLPGAPDATGDAPRTENGERDFPAAMWVITQIDEDGEAARDRARRALAFFFSTPGYETAAEGEPWADAPERIRRRFAETRADWDAVSAEVPDEMVDAMTLAGTPDEVRARLPGLEARLADLGVGELVFQTGADLDEPTFVANCRQIIACCHP